MKKNLLPIILLVTSFGYLSAQSTGIGTTKPDASARLDLSSNNQGILIPRISLTSTTVASPVTSPATSLMVYNTATINNVTPGYYYWDGTQWVRFQMAVAGAGGNTILNGTSAPVTTTGNVGDFYINTATNQIFGPKTTSGWGVGTSLVGPAGATGAAGAAGKSMLSGSGAPTAATGITGDTYVDNVTGFVYSKATGSWVSTGQSLKGPTGAAGATGPQGPAGTNGTNGTNGADGKSMLSGSGAPTAATGITGDTYVDNVTGFVYSKATGSWVSTGQSLKGPTGAAGATGPQGIQGIAGPTGPAGAAGAAGAAGKSMLSGSGAPTATTGITGDTYVDNVTGFVYSKATGSWVSTGQSLKGPTGATGPQGPSGATSEPWFAQATQAGATTNTENIYQLGNVGIGTNAPASKLDVNGQISGGFGAMATSGVLDWNDISNARSGNGLTLLHGNATNGPTGLIGYFHPFSFEYTSKNGSGNMTQLAIPYAGGSLDQGLHFRSRYSATWSPWQRIISENQAGNVGIGTYTPTAKLDVAGTARVQNLPAGATTDNLVVADASGNLKTIAQSTINNTTASNGITEVGNDIQLGGALTKVTTLTTTATNTLAIAGLQTGATTDEVVTADASGNLRKIALTTAVSSSEPWRVQGGTTPATLNTQHIYQTGNVMASSGALQSTFSTAEGGQLQLLNPSKTGANISNWTIFNMTGTYGNGLNFWRYAADATNVGPAVTFADNGNVGIGMNAPTEKLDINGNIQLSSGAKISSPGRLHIAGEETLYLLNKQGVRVSKSWSGNGNLAVEGQTTLLDVPTGTNTDNILVKGTDNIVKQISPSTISAAAEPWKIIGTTNPATDNTQNIYQTGNVVVGENASGSGVLSVVKSNAANNTRNELLGMQAGTDPVNGPTRLGLGVIHSTTATNRYAYISSGDNLGMRSLILNNNGSGAFGNVGIYTSSPLAKFHIGNGADNSISSILVTSAETPFRISTYQGATGANALVGELGMEYNSTKNSMIKFYRGGSTTGGSIAFSTNNDTEAMRITSNQSVGIGTATPTAKLDVAGTARVQSLPAGAATDNLVVADASGNLKTIAQSSINNTTASNGITEVGNDIQLGGALTKATTLTTTATNTLAIAGLQTGAATDNVLLTTTSGVVKSIPASTLIQGNNQNIYNTDGTLTGPRTVNMAGNTLHFSNGPVQMTQNASALSLVGTDHQYIQFYPRGIANGRKGYLGFAAAGTNDITVGADTAGAKIKLANSTDVNGDLTVSGTSTLVNTPTGAATDNILVKGTDNIVKQISPTTISAAAEPWKIIGTTNPATDNTQNIYQTGNVVVGENANGSGVLSVVKSNAANNTRNELLGMQAGTDPVNGPTRLGLGVIHSTTAANRYAYIGSGDNVGMRPLILNNNGSGAFGNVGIYTSSPLAKFHIGNGADNSISSILVTSNETPFRISTYQGATGANALVGELGMEYNSTKNSMIKFYRGGSTTGGSIAFSTNNDTEAMRITSNQSVGIGTATPTAKLDVAGTARVQSLPAGATTDEVVTADASGNLRKIALTTAASSSEPWRVQGGTTPATLNTQHIYQTGNVMASSGALQSTFSTAEGGQLQLLNPSKTGANISNWTIYNMTGTYGNRLNFWRYAADGTNVGPAVTFADNGNVGIGMNAPTEKLDISGNIQLSSGAKITSPGRLHITGEETLYLLNKQGVRVSKSWSGNGNLAVEGQTTLLDVPTGAGTDNILVKGTDNIVKQISPTTISAAAEPWQVQGTTNPATTNAQNIFQTGSVAIGRNNATTKLDVEGDVTVRSRLVLSNANTSHQIFNYAASATSNPLYLGTGLNSDGSKNNIILYNLSCNTGCNFPQFTAYADNTLLDGTATISKRLNVNGDYTIIKGLGNEQAYLGGDGAGNDVQLGSMNPAIADVSVYGASGYMNLTAKNLNATGNLNVSGTSTLGTVATGAITDNVLLRDAAGLVKQIPASTLIQGNNQNIYNSNGTVTSARTVNQNGNNITFQGGELINSNANGFRWTQGNFGMISRNDGAAFYLLPTLSGAPLEGWSTDRPFTYNFSNKNVLLAETSGNVGIGTAAPTAKLHVSGNSNIESNGGGFNLIGTNHIYTQYFPQGTAAGRKAYVGFAASGATDFSFGNEAGGKFLFLNNTQVNADLTVTGTIYQTSDAKFKKDIKTLQTGASTISSLRPVTYKWNDEGVKHGGDANKEQIGFIAQEVEKVLPDAVQTDKDGNKSVNYVQVVPVLTKAVQELKSENEQLKKEQEELKSRLDKIEALLNTKK